MPRIARDSSPMVVELIELIADGIRVLNDDQHGEYELPEELIMERAYNIATCILGTFELKLQE